MKTKHVKSSFALVVALFIVFLNSSCNKDWIDAETLVGSWSLAIPAAPGAVDAIVFYEFDKDGNCKIDVTDYLEGKSRVEEYRYKISKSFTRLTLIRNDGNVRDYKVLKFTNSYMKLMPIVNGNNDNDGIEFKRNF